MKLIHHFISLFKIMQLPREKRRLVFYSEGKNYWVHLEGIIHELLSKSDVHICYITSGADDPGLSINNPQFSAFKIDDGSIRNWLFENIDTDVMVMTMPDLDQYQVKRSKHKVHYVYVQHSLVSLHMVYRPGAMDHFDTVFCSGPHHIKEIRAMEEKYNLPKKNLVEHGYGRLDSILVAHKNRPKLELSPDTPKHVLIAPSWGPDCITETLGDQVVDILLQEGFKVTLRPHPQTIIFASATVKAIVDKNKENPLFNYEGNVAGQESLHESDVMICDWSGAALDYAFGLGKPVIFIDVPRKINNPKYAELEIEPFESSIRSKIGAVIAVNELEKLGELVRKDFSLPPLESALYSPCNSSAVGADAILKILES